VAATTVGNPSSDFERWETFFNNRPEARYYDCLGNPRTGVQGGRPSKEQMGVILVDYQVYIHDVLKLRSISAMMDRLSRIFSETGHPTDAFRLKAVRDSRRGIRNLIPKRMQAEAREERQQDPVTVDILWVMLQLCELSLGLPNSWGKEIWYRFMSFLGGFTAFQLALRISEYAHTPSKRRPGEVVRAAMVVEDPNTLRPNDVSFRLKNGEVYTASMLMHYADIKLSEVDTILVKLKAAKNITNGTTEIVTYATGTTWWLDKFIGMHLVWCQWARWQRGDIYFSMRFPLGTGELKRLVPKMVGDLEKAAA